MRDASETPTTSTEPVNITVDPERLIGRLVIENQGLREHLARLQAQVDELVTIINDGKATDG